MDFAGALRVEKEKKLAHRGYNVKWVKWFCEIFQLWECGHQLKNVILKILLTQVSKAVRVVKRDLNARLEEIYLADYVVKERYNLDAAELVSLELQESTGGEELTTLGRKQLRDKHKLVIIYPLGSIVRLTQVVF